MNLFQRILVGGFGISLIVFNIQAVARTGPSVASGISALGALLIIMIAADVIDLEDGIEVGVGE